MSQRRDACLSVCLSVSLYIFASLYAVYLCRNTESTQDNVFGRSMGYKDENSKESRRIYLEEYNNTTNKHKSVYI